MSIWRRNDVMVLRIMFVCLLLCLFVCFYMKVVVIVLTFYVFKVLLPCFVPFLSEFVLQFFLNLSETGEGLYLFHHSIAMFQAFIQERCKCYNPTP